MGTVLRVLLSPLHLATQPGLTEKRDGQSGHTLRAMLPQWPHGKETAPSSTRQKHDATPPLMAVKPPQSAGRGHSIPCTAGSLSPHCSMRRYMEVSHGQQVSCALGNHSGPFSLTTHIYFITQPQN